MMKSLFESRFIALLIVVMALGVGGCQKAPSREETRRIGRTAAGPIGPYSQANNRYTSYQSSRSGTVWGEITNSSGDQVFRDQLYYLTLPMLNGAAEDQQLGYVSATSRQSTGVFFWGEAFISGSGAVGSGGSGSLDGAKAKLHIEIWDDKATAGVSPTVIHFGSDYTGFQGASGSVSGSQVSLVFRSDFAQIALQGSVNGQYFTGQIYFANSATANQFYSLGNFSVQACGFFACN